MQDGSKAAEGLALASNALDAAKPLVAKAEEAKKAADAARSEMRDISRYVLDPPLPLTALPCTLLQNCCKCMPP